MSLLRLPLRRLRLGIRLRIVSRLLLLIVRLRVPRLSVRDRRRCRPLRGARVRLLLLLNVTRAWLRRLILLLRRRLMPLWGVPCTLPLVPCLQLLELRVFISLRSMPRRVLKPGLTCPRMFRGRVIRLLSCLLCPLTVVRLAPVLVMVRLIILSLLSLIPLLWSLVKRRVPRVVVLRLLPPRLPLPVVRLWSFVSNLILSFPVLWVPWLLLVLRFLRLPVVQFVRLCRLVLFRFPRVRVVFSRR